MDKDLKSLRNARWTKAFSAQSVASTALSVSSSDGAGHEERQLVTNRKATVVIEHVIQASDVAHTMQHWHVYRRWNERLFTEMYVAFNEGRAERDPADFWFRVSQKLPYSILQNRGYIELYLTNVILAILNVTGRARFL